MARCLARVTFTRNMCDLVSHSLDLSLAFRPSAPREARMAIRIESEFMAAELDGERL